MAVNEYLDKYPPSNDLDTIKHLIKLGADVNWQDDYGETVLHLAASRCSIELLKLLKESNANPEIVDRYGKTAYDSIAEFIFYTHDGNATNCHDSLPEDLTKWLLEESEENLEENTTVKSPFLWQINDED